MKRLYVPLLLFITTLCFAQQRSNSLAHPIDENLEVCLAGIEDQNGEGAIKCYYAARESWGEEVENFYRLLMETLPRPEQKNWNTASCSGCSTGMPRCSFRVQCTAGSKVTCG